MQQILSFQMIPYFAFGQNKKTSLIAQFCRQNNYQHLKSPILESIKQSFTKHTIIEGSIDLFKNLEPIHPELRVIFVGNQFQQQEQAIRNDYRKIGKCFQYVGENYQQFRKTLFPNLIFVYSPSMKQVQMATRNLASYIDYVYVKIPKNSNDFIKQFKKTVNYVVEGLFTSPQQLSILQKYFNIKIIHLQFNRVDWPQQQSYFDKEFELVPYLKQKAFYKNIKGCVLSQMKKALCPQLIYLLLDTAQKRIYVDNYVKKTNNLILSIPQIQSINKRKNVVLALTSQQKQMRLSSIIYKHFNVRQIFIMDFPYTYQEVYYFEEAYVSKFSKFVDLVDLSKNSYHKFFTAQMYFLQNQKRIAPRIDVPLQYQISDNVNYWVLNGPPGSGKTTIAKILNAQYNLKHIQFQPYLASVKEKLIAPEDGEELPLKKVFAHFKGLINNDTQSIYVIDGLPYQNKDWIAWIQQVGQPSIINIQCGQIDSIKRTRKKNQGDVNAQITEQQLTKAKQNFKKVHKNIEVAKQIIPSIQVLQLSFSDPLILAQKKIHQLFRKRIYLIPKNVQEFTLFHNIAIKNNLDVLNLNKIPLRQSLPLLRKCKRKDVFLFGYSQSNDTLISQDLYWIQKNMGDIRYLAVWNSEQKQKNEEKMKLQKPQEQIKAKVQGQGQQKPAQQSEKPAVFDIYSHQWTRPTSHYNLTQWYFKSKKNIKESQNSRKQCYKEFQQIFKQIKESSSVCFYSKVI